MERIRKGLQLVQSKIKTRDWLVLIGPLRGTNYNCHFAPAISPHNMIKNFAFWSLLLFALRFVAVKCSDSESDYHTEDESPRTEDESVKKLTEALHNETFFEYFPQAAPGAAYRAPPAAFERTSPLSCRDPEGKGVDWWFIYKEQQGTRFLYYSSDHVKKNINATPLADNCHITNYYTSPLLRTMYQNYGIDDSSVWLAWNDQTGDSKDAYGRTIKGDVHAHAKGFYAVKAVAASERFDQASISSYAIMHSLPNFPNIPMQQELNGIHKHTLPPPDSVFHSNITKFAQHFMCVSFQRATVPYQNGEIVYDATSEAQPSHVFFLQKYLRTIHPAIVGTNFNDSDTKFAFWRQYFSFFRMPFRQAYTYLAVNSLDGFSSNDLPAQSSNGPEQNLFPLPVAPFLLKSGKPAVKKESRWGAKFSAQNGCVSGSEKACFAEAVISSTAFQDQITFKLFAKHGASKIDLYDDWAALQLSELQTCFKRDYSKQIPPQHAMLVQTWKDSWTLPKKPGKKIYAQDGELMASVHINNVGSVTLPVTSVAIPGTMSVYQTGSKSIDTFSEDHSKWLLGFTIDSFNGDLPAHRDEAKFIPMFCIGDLNRTHKQASLKDNDEGRGGGLACTTNRNLWRVMISLNPKASRPKFANSGKAEALQIQNRLRPHCASAFHSSAYDRIKLTPFRDHFFRLLRIATDPLKTNKSVDFVSFLSEMSQFLVRARNNAEKQVFYAFQKFYHRVARGKVRGAAEHVWSRIPSTRNLTEALVPILRRLPALVLDRHEPERLNGPDKKVLVHYKDTFEFGLMDGDSPEYLEHMRKQLESHASIGTQTEDFEQEDEAEDDEDEDEDYEEGESEPDSEFDEDDEEFGSDEEVVIGRKYNYEDDDDDASTSSRDSENYYRDYGDCERVHRALHGYSSDEERSSQSERDSEQDSENENESENESKSESD